MGGAGESEANGVPRGPSFRHILWCRSPKSAGTCHTNQPYRVFWWCRYPLKNRTCAKKRGTCAGRLPVGAGHDDGGQGMTRRLLIELVGDGAQVVQVVEFGQGVENERCSVKSVGVIGPIFQENLGDDAGVDVLPVLGAQTGAGGR